MSHTRRASVAGRPAIDPVAPRPSPAASSALVLAALAMAGCGDPAAAPGWAGSVDTLPGGTVVVTSPGEGVWGDEPGWRLKRVARIGALGGVGPEVFGRIAAVDVGDDGRVHVLDGQAREVRVFDSAGAFVRRFGGEGGGPGEFRAPVWLEVGRGGLTWVSDIRSRRLTAFDPAGGLVTTRPWGSYGGFFGAHRITGDAVTEEIGVIERRETPRGRVDRFAGRAVVRRPLDDETAAAGADTLRLPEFEPPMFQVQLAVEGGIATRYFTVPYAPRQVVAIGPAGDVWIGRSDAYRLARVELDGDTTRVVARTLPPAPVTDADVQRAFARAGRVREAGAELEPGLVPDTRPFFTHVVADDAGGLWVRRVEDPAGGEYAGDDPQSAWYDVFAPDGRFLGILPAPVGASPAPRITRDRLIGVARDSFDVEYVEVYRIVKNRP